MEYQKSTNLLGNAVNKVSKVSTEKWVDVYHKSDNIYNTSKQIRFKTSMLRSYLCDYSDAYIVIRGTIIVEGTNGIDKHNRSFILKNNTPFIFWYFDRQYIRLRYCVPYVQFN